MIAGPNLAQMKELAKAAVMRSFVEGAERDGTPATLRAMYVMKVAEARIVIDGGVAEGITQEAALRGITPLAMANMIEGMAQEMRQLELKRIEINLSIDAQTSQSGVMSILENLCIEL